MATNIKITALNDIGANIAATTLIPVVNMSGTPLTLKATVEELANLILAEADGITFASAASALVALNATAATTSGTVTTAAQPNITSTGTLVNLVTSGNITLAGNITVASATAPNAATDTTIAFKIPVTIDGNIYYIALTAAE
jgi:hypothetical protein